MHNLIYAMVFCLLLASCQSGKVRRPDTDRDATTLSAAEQQAGWKLLFDGLTFKGWRGFGKDKVPTGWQITDQGELHFTGKGEGSLFHGDIMTKEQFSDFELRLEWKISPGGNSGIFFRVSEKRKFSWFTGPEMQVLDNKGHKDGRNLLTSAGSNYALHAPTKDVTRQVGLYNEAMIRVEKNHVQHWLNGHKIVEYEIGSPEWQKLVANSKFGKLPDYGRYRSGHIVLQDHGDKVWYRNIRIRTL
ncbi:MAG: DUF1080 domain-containing protein [bacterium]